ncbi:LppX_LprAFG lipoprotein [Nocardioides sp. R-C-SC26]|uniref:LppX_LprAFG lipoprotein n=1 Tax=Nocardioides sp. R-C-SC26 TaxID=2870414 RepID=UPI001E5D633C|nr:LppX_LprAFG lipoprotein [Nocardioides sp. R-C-SC26]
MTSLPAALRPIRRTRASRGARALAVAATGLALAATLSACSDDDGADGGGAPANDVLGEAKTHLDETSGVRLTLATDGTADGDFLKSATGVITDAPAFEGSVDARFMGFDASGIKIVSVDGDLYVDIPVTGWSKQNPEDFCAPDPATLLDPETGVSGVLGAATDLEKGESRRGGANNDEILTDYSATVPGEAITNILPCAPGDSFDAVFSIDDEGYLRTAKLTGEFFGDDDITYTIDVEEYDVSQEISAP